MTYRLITESMYGKIDASNVEFIYKNKNYKGVEFTLSFNI